MAGTAIGPSVESLGARRAREKFLPTILSFEAPREIDEIDETLHCNLDHEAADPGRAGAAQGRMAILNIQL
jgi:hypothetical protein